MRRSGKVDPHTSFRGRAALRRVIAQLPSSVMLAAQALRGPSAEPDHLIIHKVGLLLPVIGFGAGLAAAVRGPAGTTTGFLLR